MTPINIMICENHSLFSALLKRDLAEHGIFSIAEPENGLQLLALLTNIKPDLVLLDIDMPVLDGAQTLDLVNELHPDVKVIMFSQYEGASFKSEFIKRGAKAFITKNTPYGDFVATVRAVANGSYVYNFQEHEQTEIKLSPREIEMCHLINEEKGNKQIADLICLSEKTVEKHKASLYRKTKTDSPNALLKTIISRGLNFLYKKPK